MHNKSKRKKSLNAKKNLTDSIDFVPPNAHLSSQRASLFVSEDNDAVIKMIIKGRSPTMGHVSTDSSRRLGLVVWPDWCGPLNPNQMCQYLQANRGLSDQRII